MVRNLWVVATVALTVLAFARSPRADVANAPSSDAAVNISQCKANGSVGCAATSCHGNLDTKALTEEPGKKAWETSATRFNALDPHRKAFAVLKSEFADTISKGSGGSGVAVNDVRCLACHVNPSLANDHDKYRGLLEDGVSCEACHGNSEKWFEQHTRPGNERNYQGFQNLEDLTIRAKTCVGCHVGAPADGINPTRDMNHDMIAAGHPRLDFDFASQSARMPRHWREEQSVERLHESWRIGERVYAQARLDLLKDRAMRANQPRSPWPELSEQSCYSCHRVIDPMQARGGRGIAPWSGPELADAADLVSRLNVSRIPPPDKVAELAKMAKVVEPSKISDQLKAIATREIVTPDDAFASFRVLAVAYETLARSNRADENLKADLVKLSKLLMNNREPISKLQTELRALGAKLQTALASQ